MVATAACSAQKPVPDPVSMHTPELTVACGCDQRASDVSEHPVGYLARVEHGCGRGDQLIVQSIAHERTLPA
jgi:hypothetical protein